MNNQDFVKLARLAHGDRYDYSLLDFTKGSEKVTIVCLLHGVFTQKASSHLAGFGCDKCAHHQFKFWSTETFVEQCKKVHGDRYDYSLTVYKNPRTRIIIGCHVHGKFEQLPYNHIKKHGCRLCNHHHKEKLTTEEFIRRSEKTHGKVYDYSNAVYTGSAKELEIICLTHGPFKQRAISHYRGSGCPKCGMIISIEALTSVVRRLG